MSYDFKCEECGGKLIIPKNRISKYYVCEECGLESNILVSQNENPASFYKKDEPSFVIEHTTEERHPTKKFREADLRRLDLSVKKRRQYDRWTTYSTDQKRKQISNYLFDYLIKLPISDIQKRLITDFVLKHNPTSYIDTMIIAIKLIKKFNMPVSYTKLVDALHQKGAEIDWGKNEIIKKAFGVERQEFDVCRQRLKDLNIPPKYYNYVFKRVIDQRPSSYKDAMILCNEEVRKLKIAVSHIKIIETMKKQRFRDQILKESYGGDYNTFLTIRKFCDNLNLKYQHKDKVIEYMMNRPPTSYKNRMIACIRFIKRMRLGISDTRIRNALIKTSQKNSVEIMSATK